MIKQILARGRQFIKSHPLSTNYGIDGLLTLGAVSIAANNSNLFAQRLGAGDFHLSMLQFLPHIINLFLLIPLGLMVDSLTNKRRILSILLIIAGLFFASAGMSAFVPVHTVYFFLIAVGLANVSSGGLFNMTWQAFFPEAVDEEGFENRNAVLTFRARMTMIVSLIAPLTVGFVLTRIPSDDGKIIAHQVFFIFAAVLLVINSFHIRKIKAVHAITPKRVSIEEIKTAGRRLVKNKAFIVFTLVIFFFHMGWHIDWTLFFISQANYLQMNELMLSLTPVVGMLAQLLTLRFWSRNNSKQGVEFPLVYGMMGLIASPIAIIVGTSLPLSIGPWVFLLIHGAGQLAFANITLNLFQCLLKVIDNEYRSLFISMYTCLITLSNAVMPVVGVAIYRGFGADLRALHITFVIILVIRVLTVCMWLLRLKFMPTQPMEVD